MNKIENFREPYDFLSNFYNCRIIYKGITYWNAEAAYQAQKCPKRAEEFCNLLGSEAKKLGRLVEIRSDWEDIKLDIMEEIVTEKFCQNSDLMEKLLATDELYIEEGNWWGDTFWGVCTNKKMDHVGKNHLGKILMEVRTKEKFIRYLADREYEVCSKNLGETKNEL